MKKENFYHRFANLPLPTRMIKINDTVNSEKRYVNMDHIYKQVKKIDELLRPHEIEREKWLRLAEVGLEQIKAAQKR